MITNFKIFETFDDYASWKEGDTVICVSRSEFTDSPDFMNDHMALKLGHSYTIKSIVDYPNNRTTSRWLVLNGIEGEWGCSRFTKNTSHPLLKKLAQNRFDL